MGSSILRILLRFGALGFNALLFGAAAHYLSQKEMGIWALASSMTSIVMSLDLGAASFLRDKLSRSSHCRMEIFSSGIFVTSLLSILYATIAGITFFIPIKYLGFIGNIDFAVPYICLALLFLAIRLPGSVALNGFYSFNEPNLFGWFEFIGLMSSVLITLIAFTISNKLYIYVGAYYIAGTIVNLIALCVFINKRGWKLRFKFNRNLFLIIRGGMPWGLLQIVGLILSTLPIFIVGGLLNIEDVTPMRAIMMIGQTIIALHLAHAMPIWTKFSELNPSAKNDKLLKDLKVRLIKESIFLGGALLFLASFIPFILSLWIDQHNVSLNLSFLIMLWSWGCGICNIYSLAINGSGKPLMTMSALLPGGLAALGLAPFLADLLGMTGVGIAFTIGAWISALLMIVIANKEIELISI